ncbi:hypothetical protein JNK13_03110 [bacterium]|nr:hypothetical protein [bacterium]
MWITKIRLARIALIAATAGVLLAFVGLYGANNLYLDAIKNRAVNADDAYEASLHLQRYLSALEDNGVRKVVSIQGHDPRDPLLVELEAVQAIDESSPDKLAQLREVQSKIKALPNITFAVTWKMLSAIIYIILALWLLNWLAGRIEDRGESNDHD